MGMRLVRRALLPALTTPVLLFGLAPSAHAIANVPGGTSAPSLTAPASGPGSQAPSLQRAGGSEYGVQAQAAGKRPTVISLSVPRTITAGSLPRVSFQIAEAGVGTVAVQVNVTALSAPRPSASASLGWVHTARTVIVRWPLGATLAPGSYQVSLSVHDHHGAALLRRAHSSGIASLTVSAPPPPPKAPTPAPTPVQAPIEAGVATPAQTLASGAVFPVAGAHSFGGPENRFGAPRGTHIHQGQDVLTAEGTPDLLPLAGTILSTSYQAGGAGYYAVERTAEGFDLMFAHCQAGSLVVATGQPVSAGQELCKAGQTGDATAPHLHFEMWVGGWQAATGHPIDPLPYLEAWEHPATEG
jgi:murein DD-endopeptidase MepM/ murein hydrolase activator NlpD